MFYSVDVDGEAADVNKQSVSDAYRKDKGKMTKRLG